MAWETDKVICPGCRAVAQEQDDVPDGRRRWTTITLKPVPREEAEARIEGRWRGTASGPDRPAAGSVAPMTGGAE